MYTVSAIDAAGNEGPQSAPVSVLYDHTPPPAPFGLSVPAVTRAAGAYVERRRPRRALRLRHYQVLRDGAVDRLDDADDASPTPG